MKKSRIIIAFLFWRVLLHGIALVSPRFFSFNPSYPYYFGFLDQLAPWWIARWAGFDGVHYLTIAMKGYIGTGLIQAFFPIYPKLISLFNFLGSPVLTGLFFSHLFAILSLIMLFLLYTLQEHSKKSWAVIPSLLLFPVSFYLVSLYSESLFLFLVLLVFYLAKKKAWLSASFVAAIASATRISGIFLVPALMFAIYQEYKERKTVVPWKKIVTPLIGSIGLLFYMLFLFGEFKDPLYFLHVQEEFAGGRQEQLILFPQVMYRYVRIFLTVEHFSWQYFSYVQEFLLTLIVGTMLILQTVRKSWKIKGEYLVYSWLSFLLPPLTGTFQSMPRYVLVIFPIYFFLAKLAAKHPRLYWLILCISGILLLLNTMLFFQGRWVA